LIEAFTQELVSRITGLTRRQLEYWDQIGVLSPSVAGRSDRGDPALYSFADVIRLAVAAEMRRRDMLPGEIREMAKALEAEGVADPLLTIQFVGDPKSGRAFLLHPRTREPEAAKHRGQQASVYDLDLKDLRTGLIAKIEALTRRKPGKVVRLRSVQGSHPVLEGTRVPTAKIATLAAGGWDEDRIMQAFPRLTRTDVNAALIWERRHSEAAKSA
jgi:uncharacterized protein (DUF433 family)